MSSSVPPFKAYVIRQDENRKVSAAMEPLTVDGLDAERLGCRRELGVERSVECLKATAHLPAAEIIA